MILFSGSKFKSIGVVLVVLVVGVVESSGCVVPKKCHDDGPCVGSIGRVGSGQVGSCQDSESFQVGRRVHVCFQYLQHSTLDSKLHHGSMLSRIECCKHP